MSKRVIPARPAALTATVLAIGVFAHCAVAEVKPKEFSGMSFLDNGEIRLGVNLDIGGAITYLADSKKRINVINSYDWGRQVQMSFYSGPRPFEPNGKKPSSHWSKLGWNPIQSGDYKGFRSKVIAHTNDKKTIYIKCIPMHWPLANVPGRCTFECRLSLDGRAVKVWSRLNNARADKTQYQGRHQELPAVYTNGPYYRLMSYTGDKPFTGDKVVRIIQKTKPWQRFTPTECWSALVNDSGWGLGVWHPGRGFALGGFAGKPGAGGPKDNPTGYISPLHSEILDCNIRYEYSYALVLDTLANIRKYVYKNAKRPAPPNYVFKSDRQHWIYRNATDTGWPIEGELHVKLDQRDPQMIGPVSFWSAADAPRLYIRAAFKTKATHGHVMWRIGGAEGRSFGQNNTAFEITGDGKYRTYEVDLSASPKYKGVITQLRFDPVPSGAKGDFVKVQSIAFARPAKRQ
ncbi:MAG: hypothetical protein QGG42_06290 [Phycisphaerae bacterium]|jgi:hypothetical protein|nr:hypothetical protein [Phycisphaerae bacterium]